MCSTNTRSMNVPYDSVQNMSQITISNGFHAKAMHASLWGIIVVLEKTQPPTPLQFLQVTYHPFISIHSSQKLFVCKDSALVKFNSVLSALCARPGDISLFLISFPHDTEKNEINKDTWLKICTCEQLLTKRNLFDPEHFPRDDSLIFWCRVWWWWNENTVSHMMCGLRRFRTDVPLCYESILGECDVTSASESTVCVL